MITAENMVASRRLARLSLKQKLEEMISAAESSEPLFHAAAATLGRVHLFKVESQFVYAIQCGDRIKFGRTVGFRSRFSSLKATHVEPVEALALIFYNGYVENLIHKHLWPHRLKGEWFKADEPSVQNVVELMRNFKAEELLTIIDY